MRAILCPDAGEPHGHYSHAMVHAGVVYVSGILGGVARPDQAGMSAIEAQCRYCLDELGKILVASGSGMDRLLKLNVYVTDVEHWPVVNRVCAERLGPHRPARAVIGCGTLRLGSLIEVDAIAAAPVEQQGPAPRCGA